MLHFYDDPFEYEAQGYDPYYDIKIGPPPTLEMILQRIADLGPKLMNMSHETHELSSDRDDREWEVLQEQWQQYKRNWKRRHLRVVV